MFPRRPPPLPPLPLPRPGYPGGGTIIDDLTVKFGSFTAVDGVDLEIPPGSVVGLVGESGAGKSTVGRALAGLASYQGRITGPDRRRIQLVFQDPYASLDPRMTVGAAVAEGLRGPRDARRGEVERLLSLVALDRSAAARYPRELSGGERQRVAIARALGADPELLVADEITAALDVSVQGAVLNLIRDLHQTLGLSILFISHNLAVVRYLADSVAVMRGGRLVESGPVDQVVGDPGDEYTRALLRAVPRLEIPGADTPAVEPPGPETPGLETPRSEPEPPRPATEPPPLESETPELESEPPPLESEPPPLESETPRLETPGG